MSRLEKTVAIVMVVAIIGLVGVLGALLLTGPQAPMATTVPRASVILPSSPTLELTSTGTAVPPSLTPVPTDTPRPTRTPEPTETPSPTHVLSPTPTPTDTATPTPTRRPTSAVRPVFTAPSGGGAVPSTRLYCGTPNGNPTNGKLDVTWSIVSWRTSPRDEDRAIGAIVVMPSGGGDCYKFNFLGRDYEYLPIEFEMNKCGTMTGALKVTSADGSTWRQDFMISADAPEFKCK